MDENIRMPFGFGDVNDQQTNSSRRQRSSGVYSRVRNTPQDEQRDLANIRQQLNFVTGAGEDEQDRRNEAINTAFFGNVSNEITATRPKNQAGMGQASSTMSSFPSDSASLPEGEDFPDQAMILERLTKIRQHKRQVLDMIDKLKHETGDGEMDKDMLRKMIEAYDNFKEQEEQYLSILQKILTLKSEFATALEDTAIEQPSPQTKVKTGTTKQPVPKNLLPSFRHDGSIPSQVGRRDDNGGSGFLSGENLDDDELQTLIEQRNVLRQMLRQQEEMRALQGLQKAQQAQNLDGASAMSENECDEAYRQVYEQQAVLAEKRRELEELKKKLELARAAYSETPDQYAEEAASVDNHQQHYLDDKLGVLRDKKQKMDEIIHELNALQRAAHDEGRRAHPASGTTEPAFVNYSGARPKDPVVPPSGRSAPKTDQAGKINIRIPVSEFVGSPAESIKQKLMELEATKSRLAQLQTLVTDLQVNGGTSTNSRGLGVSPQLLRLVHELEVEGEGGMDMTGSDNGEMSAQNMQLKSAYNQKLNEQRDAVEKLQEEHSRLTAIKNQLLKLNPLADPLHDEKARMRQNSGIPIDQRSGLGMDRSGDDVWHSLRQQTQARGHDQRRPLESQSGFEHRLNNTEIGDLPSASNRTRSGHMLDDISPGLFAAAALSFGPPLMNDGENEQPPIDSRRGTDSNASTIVSNPRLASFRRNNQLDEGQKQRLENAGGGRASSQSAHGYRQSTPTVGTATSNERQLRRRRSSSAIGSQYQQLQQHIDSIRLIFQDLVKAEDENELEHQPQPGSNINPAVPQQLPVAQANAGQLSSSAAFSSWDPLSLGQSAAFNMQQHQMMLSLLACQQQLQLQQLELRYLQQLCQELWQSNCSNEGGRTRSGSVTSVQHQSNNNQVGLPGFPFGAVNFAPFDGRPLSSASLYNLLAPNPYLTFPYYPPQFGQHGFGPMAARGLVMNNSNNGTIQPVHQGGGVLNNSYIGPAVANNAADTARSNRNIDNTANSGRLMSTSATSQDGQYRGRTIGDRMIVSDSEISIVGETSSSPFKVGSAGRAIGSEYVPAASGKATVPKLNLEDSLNKSNVIKGNKNSNMGKINGVIPELPSRASSTSGHQSRLENGSMTPDQFDIMREVIYSEVATLISQNEQRPSFLLELFRELQLLSNDYLRTRALDVIRDLLNRYLTDDTDAAYSTDLDRSCFSSIPVTNQAQVVDAPTAVAPTNPANLEKDNSRLTRNIQSVHNSRSNVQDYVERILSGSSIASTPDQVTTADLSANTNTENKSSGRQKRFEHLEGIKDVKNANANGTAVSVFGDLSRSQSRDLAIASAILASNSNASGGAKVDVSGLEQQIQTIIDDLIPFVRGNVDAECAPQLLQYLRKLILELTTSKCVPPESVSTFFRLQLSSILDDTLAKFRGQKLHECGAELLADVSEVVFNELAFFRLMQNIDSSPVTRQQGVESENSTTSMTTSVTSESATADDVVSETNDGRGESELSSSRQSSLEDELSPLSIHDAGSEVSEDLSAITAVSVGLQETNVTSANIEQTGNEAVAESVMIVAINESAGVEASADSVPTQRSSNGHRKSIETVLMAPLMVQVTAATDEEEITTTNNSSSSLNTSSSESSGQSMHTAGGDGSLTSDNVEMLKTPPTGDSRETSPPDDTDEVPEQLEQEPASPISMSDVKFDLSFEPHPENQAQLTPNANADILLTNVNGVDEEEEEEDGDEHVGTNQIAPTSLVAARATAYLAEGNGNESTIVNGVDDVSHMNQPNEPPLIWPALFQYE